MKNKKLVWIAALSAGVHLSASAAIIIAEDDCSSSPNNGTGWTSNWEIMDPVVSDLSSDGQQINFLANRTSDQYFGRDSGYNLNNLGASEKLRIKYDIIVGSDLSNFTANTDQLGATFRVNSDTTAGAGSDSTFIIRAYGDESGGAAEAKAWGAYNGNADNGSFSSANFENMGMSVATDTTYSFTIDLDAALLTYDIMIDNGTTTASKTGLGWRTSLDGTNGILSLGMRQDTATDNFGFGVDNVEISVVPEPATLGLLGAAGIFLMAVRRFRI